MTAPRDWADEVAAVIGATESPEYREALAVFLRGDESPGAFREAMPGDYHAAYLAGHAAGKREATTWRDPVADPPEVPEGARWTYVVLVRVLGSRPSVGAYRRDCGWGEYGPPLAWLPIPPLPKGTDGKL
jgi:hypothetical protein